MIKAADFYPEALNPFTVGSTLNCLPQNISGTVVYYDGKPIDAAIEEAVDEGTKNLTQ